MNSFLPDPESFRSCADKARRLARTNSTRPGEDLASFIGLLKRLNRITNLPSTLVLRLDRVGPAHRELKRVSLRRRQRERRIVQIRVDRPNRKAEVLVRGESKSVC